MQNLNIVLVGNSTYIKINRRDIVQNLNMIVKRMHYKMHKPATPPKEGNDPAVTVCVGGWRGAVGMVRNGTLESACTESCH